MTIYTFPIEWYPLVVSPGKYRLRSMSQVASRPWTGGRNVSGPHARVFMVEAGIAPQLDPTRQDIAAFFQRLKGQADVLRFADATRLAPWYDRNIDPTVATWSDGSTFTDGTGFANGHLPPNVFVYSAAARGANYIVLGGFPASTANVLRQGDPLEIKPNGIAAEFPHRYECTIPGSSDSSGRVGVSIEPNLRQGIAAGDQVSLRYASTLFRMIDDSQAEMSTEGAGIGSLGFSAIESVDLVP